MIRRQIYLTSIEVEVIQDLADKLEISVSEYIRRVLDQHILEKKGISADDLVEPNAIVK